MCAIDRGMLPQDWSNEKDIWVNDSPMTCMERLVSQAEAIKAINPETKIWVYRESVAAQPWYAHASMSSRVYASGADCVLPLCAGTPMYARS